MIVAGHEYRVSLPFLGCCFPFSLSFWRLCNMSPFRLNRVFLTAAAAVLAADERICEYH